MDSFIVKIQALADYHSPSDEFLSFRKGQLFYALTANYNKSVYYVSTQYSTPFSRTSVNGLVPLKLFQVVDLMKGKQYHPNVTSEESNPHDKRAAYFENIANAVIHGVAVEGVDYRTFTIRIQRDSFVHYIKRTDQEIYNLQKEIRIPLAFGNRGAYMQPDKFVTFLNQCDADNLNLGAHLAKEFFKPRNVLEGQLTPLEDIRYNSNSKKRGVHSFFSLSSKKSVLPTL